MWWRDNLKFLGFKSNEYLLVGNDGDGPVHVSHASLEMDLSPFAKDVKNENNAHPVSLLHKGAELFQDYDYKHQAEPEQQSQWLRLFVKSQDLSVISIIGRNLSVKHY